MSFIHRSFLLVLALAGAGSTAPAAEMKLQGTSPKSCNETSSSVPMEICNAESVSVSGTVDVGISTGLASGVGMTLGFTSTQTTGISASTCASPLVAAGTCVYFEYTFECEVEKNWFTGQWVVESCDLIQTSLKETRPCA